MNVIKNQFYLLLLIILFQIIITQAEDDIVKSIPDYEYSGRLFSGYLDVNNVKKFHYFFNYAHEDPENKPLVLWLAGGPGCSALDTWANEHGPMTIGTDGNFHINEYSWNRAANMIYLEAPGDVGFSYIDSNLDYEKYINDDIAANDNLQALLNFFQKFPSMKGKDFYISGESYGGIFVPMLAYNIIQYNKNLPESKKINLKGVIIGNGVTDWNVDNTPAAIDFAFTHHLYSYETRMDYNEYCIMNYDLLKCEEAKETMDQCLEGINIYDYLQDCAIPETTNGEISYHSTYYKYARWAFKNKRINKDKNAKLKESNISSCIDSTNAEKYFNRKDVQNALHVEARREWTSCSGEVGDRYEMQEKGSIWAYPTLLKEGIRILFYTGDTDVLVPFNGSQKWIKNLRLEIEKPWRQWRAFNDQDNVSGYAIKYKGLIFTTIKGTGHLPPRWKQKECYYMFSKFLNEEDF
jgi:carboxypeptidase C (cathepsin A)